MKTARLALQPEKFYFLKREIAYLGHVITQEGVKPDPKKIEAVEKFPIPKNKKNIKQFLGLIRYYRKFIPDFAKLAKPLTVILKDKVPFKWTEIERQAFQILKNKIISRSLLQYPDFAKPFIVTTDASDYALGGVLSRGQIGQDLPIAFASRTLQGAELNYSTIEKELLAIVFCVKHFRPYLYGRKFTLVTYHRPLVRLHGLKDPASRLARWRIKLSEYEYDIAYKPEGSIQMQMHHHGILVIMVELILILFMWRRVRSLIWQSAGKQARLVALEILILVVILRRWFRVGSSELKRNVGPR